MPKEIIYDEAAKFDVHIGWYRGADNGSGSVQVGVETHEGVPLTEVLAEVPAEEIPLFRGVWGTLDRAGVNRLIRTLRRARDQAFGRDE